MVYSWVVEFLVICCFLLCTFLQVFHFLNNVHISLSLNNKYFLKSGAPYEAFKKNKRVMLTCRLLWVEQEFKRKGGGFPDLPISKELLTDPDTVPALLPWLPRGPRSRVLSLPLSTFQSFNLPKCKILNFIFFYKHLNGKPCSRCFPHISLFNPHNSTMRWILLWCTMFRNGGTVK